MNRSERRAAARRMVHRDGKDADSTRRVRSKLAESLKVTPEDVKTVGSKPRAADVADSE